MLLSIVCDFVRGSLVKANEGLSTHSHLHNLHTSTCLRALQWHYISQQSQLWCIRLQKKNNVKLVRMDMGRWKLLDSGLLYFLLRGFCSNQGPSKLFAVSLYSKLPCRAGWILWLGVNILCQFPWALKEVSKLFKLKVRHNWQSHTHKFQ